MGAVADAALDAGGDVVGVIPQHLVDREVAHDGLTELRVTGDARTEGADGRPRRRVRRAARRPQHIEELAEILTWSQLGLQSKPCGLLDVEGFFDPLLAFLDHTVTERFVSTEHRALVLAADRPDSLLDLLAGWRPGTPDARGLDR